MKKNSIIRLFLALPFLIIGGVLLKIAEIISKEKFQWGEIDDEDFYK